MMNLVQIKQCKEEEEEEEGKLLFLANYKKGFLSFRYVCNCELNLRGTHTKMNLAWLVCIDNKRALFMAPVVNLFGS